MKADNLEPFPNLSYKTLEHNRHEIDLCIATKYKELCAIKRDRNMNTPINAKLVPEILSRVFFHVKNEMCPDRWVNPSACPYHTRTGWIKCVTHVCSHWRSIALSDPTLWTDCFPDETEGVETFLERSKDRPVVLDMRLTDLMSYIQPLRTLVLPHIRRASKLELTVLESDLEDILDALDNDMPHLSALNINFATEFDAIEDFTPRHALSFPRPRNLRSVRDLRLKFYGFSWDQAGLNNLTRLDITGDRNPAHDPSMIQIIDVLRRSPSLEKLVLRDIVLSNAQHQDTTSAEVSLRFLDHMCLYQTGLAFTELLVRRAILPRLRFISLDVSTNDEVTAIGILASATRHLHRHHIRTITTSLNGLVRNIFVYESSYFGESSLWFRNETQHITDFSQTILRCMDETDLSTLEELYLEAHTHLPIDWWNRVFCRANALKRLSFDGSFNPGGLISALMPAKEELGKIRRKKATEKSQDDDAQPLRSLKSSPPFAETDDSDKPTIIALPSLTALIFDVNSFTPRNCSHDGRITEGSIKHLECCLEQRAVCGFRLPGELSVPQTKAELDSMGVELWRHVGRVSYGFDPQAFNHFTWD